MDHLYRRVQRVNVLCSTANTKINMFLFLERDRGGGEEAARRRPDFQVEQADTFLTSDQAACLCQVWFRSPAQGGRTALDQSGTRVGQMAKKAAELNSSPLKEDVSFLLFFCGFWSLFHF